MTEEADIDVRKGDIPYIATLSVILTLIMFSRAMFTMTAAIPIVGAVAGGWLHYLLHVIIAIAVVGCALVLVDSGLVKRPHFGISLSDLNPF